MSWLPNWTEKTPEPPAMADPEPGQVEEVIGVTLAATSPRRPQVRWEVATPQFLAWIDRGVTLKGLERSLGERFWEKGPR